MAYEKSIRPRTEGSAGNTKNDESTGEIVLDNLIWNSLIGGHYCFALGQNVGTGAARRYPPTMGPFAGLRRETVEAFGNRSLQPIGGWRQTRGSAPGVFSSVFEGDAIEPTRTHGEGVKDMGNALNH